tara:strand:- start:14 stop:1132 length:1119 start_codon:yes stop_codon:yes gene_type:complete
MVFLYIIIFVYILFIIWVLDGYKNLVKNKKKHKIKNTFYISIIVAARNEENNIQNLLDSLLNQSLSHNNYEIIIVNDRSTDNTKEIIKQSCKKYKNIKLINISQTPENWTGKKWALYNGIKKSKGEICVQTDADCIAKKRWLELLTEHFHDPSIGFVSSLTPLIGGNNLFEKLLCLDSIVQDGLSACILGKGLILSCTARSMAYRKSFFYAAGGYNEIKNIISGDDDLMLHKLVYYTGCKTKYVINKDANISSEPPKTLTEFINQRLRFASKGMLYYKAQFISVELKIILPFLYLANFMIVVSMIQFFQHPTFLLIIPFIFKSIADFVFLNTFQKGVDIKLDWISFMFLTILHPFYVVIFGLLGPIARFKWK